MYKIVLVLLLAFPITAGAYGEIHPETQVDTYDVTVDVSISDDPCGALQASINSWFDGTDAIKRVRWTGTANITESDLTAISYIADPAGTPAVAEAPANVCVLMAPTQTGAGDSPGDLGGISSDGYPIIHGLADGTSGAVNAVGGTANTLEIFYDGLTLNWDATGQTEPAIIIEEGPGFWAGRNSNDAEDLTLASQVLDGVYQHGIRNINYITNTRGSWVEGVQPRITSSGFLESSTSTVGVFRTSFHRGDACHLETHIRGNTADWDDFGIIGHNSWETCWDGTIKNVGGVGAAFYGNNIGSVRISMSSNGQNIVFSDREFVDNVPYFDQAEFAVRMDFATSGVRWVDSAIGGAQFGLLTVWGGVKNSFTNIHFETFQDFATTRAQIIIGPGYCASENNETVGRDIDCDHLSAITGITQAATAVVSSTAHGFLDGDVITIYGVVGMTEVNGLEFTVANKNDDDFELTGINSTGYEAWSAGGIVSATAVSVDANSLMGGLHFVESGMPSDVQIRASDEEAVACTGVDCTGTLANTKVVGYTVVFMATTGTQEIWFDHLGNPVGDYDPAGTNTVDEGTGIYTIKWASSPGTVTVRYTIDPGVLIGKYARNIRTELKFNSIFATNWYFHYDPGAIVAVDISGMVALTTGGSLPPGYPRLRHDGAVSVQFGAYDISGAAGECAQVLFTSGAESVDACAPNSYTGLPGRNITDGGDQQEWIMYDVGGTIAANLADGTSCRATLTGANRLSVSNPVDLDDRIYVTIGSMASEDPGFNEATAPTKWVAYPNQQIPSVIAKDYLAIELSEAVDATDVNILDNTVGACQDFAVGCTCDRFASAYVARFIPQIGTR